MDIKQPHCTYMLICPSCKEMSLNQAVCPGCKAEIPQNTRINVIDKPTTGDEVKIVNLGAVGVTRMNTYSGKATNSAFAKNGSNVSTTGLTANLVPIRETAGARKRIIDHVSENIPIHDKDLATLNKGEKVNDTVIDAYFNISVEDRVKKWVKNVDIFSKDFIFIPTNLKGHWLLVVVCFLPQLIKETAESRSYSRYESRRHLDYRPVRTCIIYFDSFVSWSTEEEKSIYTKCLKEFFKLAWKLTRSTPPCDFDSIPVVYPYCPQQRNDVDCGLFTMQYAESFFLNPLPCFEGSTPNLQKWFPIKNMAAKREQVKAVLSQSRRDHCPIDPSCDSEVIIL